MKNSELLPPDVTHVRDGNDLARTLVLSRAQRRMIDSNRQSHNLLTPVVTESLFVTYQLVCIQ